MNLIKEFTTIPIPTVFGWSEDADDSGASSMLTECLPDNETMNLNLDGIPHPDKAGFTHRWPNVGQR